MKYLMLHIKVLLAIGMFIAFVCLSYSQDKMPISYEASYVSDFVSNVSGGVDKGSCYLGMIDIAASINTENANLWKGGELYVQVENTHGSTPTADLVGDLQVFSNIENGNYTYLYQMWYKQHINNSSLTIGVHDLNSEFLASDYAGEYINSSFGIMPTVSMNVPVSIFPKPVFGAVLSHGLTDLLNIKTAVYDGNPLSLDEEPYNTSFKLNDEKSYFAIAELTYNNGSDLYEGCYKLGAFYHSDPYTDLSDVGKTHNGNYGVYAIADQTMVSNSENTQLGIDAFAKLGVSPTDRNPFAYFWGAGVNLNNIISKRPNDICGVAIAALGINKELYSNNLFFEKQNETVVEIMYKAAISNNITIQPEMQYIINPGALKNINNAVIALLRTNISF